MFLYKRYMFRPIRVIIRNKRIKDVGHSPFIYFAWWWPLWVEICSDLYRRDNAFIIKTVVCTALLSRIQLTKRKIYSVESEEC